MPGHDRSEPRLDDLGGQRGTPDLIVGVPAGSALLPFVQAVIGKAGEDFYSVIRGKLSRRSRRRAKAELREAGTVTLAEPGARVILQLPQTISPVMALRLGSVRIPAQSDGWILVRWDAGLAQWLVDDVVEPPSSVNLL